MIYNKPEYWIKTNNIIPVTITGSGVYTGWANDVIMCSVEIGGIEYTEATTGLTVMPGDVIVCYVLANSSKATSTVKIDGTNVLSVNGTSGTYDYTVPDNTANASITIELNVANALQASITITTS